MRTGIPRERGYAAFASLNSWLHAGLSFHPNGVVVHTQLVSAYDILTSGQRSGYRLTLWTILLYACTKSNPPSRHARTRRYLIGWCCYCRCCFCCCYRCCPLCHCCCCADTHRRQRAKGTRIGVVAGGGDAVHFFVSILERVRTDYGRTLSCYTRVYQVLYKPVPVYDTRYQVLDKHAPRIPAPNISCCSIIVAATAASATILT